MALIDQVNELNQQILSGNVLGAFDTFYAEEVVMQENNKDPRVGKALNREYEENFVASIEAWHGAEVKSVAVNEATGTAAIEWFMDVTFKGGNRTQMEQVSIQQWADGQVVHERFYYASN